MSTAAQAKRYREGWDEKRRAYHREWARNRRRKLGPVAGLVYNYRLTLDEARAALAKRGEHCDICGRKARLCYDHDHVSGQHRGWLCYRCNHGLHMIEDRELHESALRYLEASRATV